MKDWRSIFRKITAERDQMMKEGPVYKECKHPGIELRALECSNGAIQYVQQCRQCGEKMSGPIAHSRVSGPVPAFDRELPKRWKRMARQNMTAEEREEVFRERWWSVYNDYLQSPEWGQKREAVLSRAGYQCEGCADQEATQVHHISYKHVGGELLFELVAVCDGCHDRCHEDHHE